MKTVIAALLGSCTGLLLGLVLRLPLLEPLPGDIASALAAAAGCVMTVAGAFLLWRHQVQKRQMELPGIAVKVFENVYSSLRLVVALHDTERLKVVFESTHGRKWADADELQEYQHIQGRTQIEQLQIYGAVASQQWLAVQDSFAAISMRDVGAISGLHSIASLMDRWLPSVLVKMRIVINENHERWRLPEPLELSLLRHCEGKMAADLNALDGGSRDTTAYTQMTAKRNALLARI